MVTIIVPFVTSFTAKERYAWVLHASIPGNEPEHCVGGQQFNDKLIKILFLNGIPWFDGFIEKNVHFCHKPRHLMKDSNNVAHFSHLLTPQSHFCQYMYHSIGLLHPAVSVRCSRANFPRYCDWTCLGTTVYQNYFFNSLLKLSFQQFLPGEFPKWPINPLNTKCCSVVVKFICSEKKKKEYKIFWKA